MHKLNKDKTVVIDPNYHWIPVSDDTPRGVKLQLINKDSNVAVYGFYQSKAEWTHYAPLPTFKKD